MENGFESAGDFDSIYGNFANTVFRVCYMYFQGNRMDAEDACQTVFMKLYNSGKRFETAEHIKAWLIRVAANVCISELRRKKPTSPIEDKEIADDGGIKEENTVLEKVMALPEGYRAVIYLFYYEEMSAKQIAKSIGVTEATVFWRLNRARNMLKEILTEDDLT